MRREVAIAVVAAGALAAFLWSRWSPAPRPERQSDSASAPSTPPTLAARADLAAAPATGTTRGQDEGQPTTSVKGLDGGEPPITLRVDLVDALTGEPVAGSWRAEDDAGAALRDTPVRRALRAGLRRLRGEAPVGTESTPTVPPPEPEATASEPFLPSGGTQALGANAGPQRIRVRVAADRTAWDADERVPLGLAAGVSRGRFTMPLHRLVPLRLSVRAPDGRPATGASVAAVTVGGRRLADLGDSRAEGELVLPIPFLPGEEVRVALEWWPPEQETLSAAGLAPEEGISSPQWTGTVPANPIGWVAEVRLEKPCSYLVDRTEVDFDLPTEESFGTGEGPETTAKIRVLDREGRPVPRVMVSMGSRYAQTDDDGLAVLGHVAIGSARFDSDPPGRLVASAVADVRGDGVVELREPKGATLEVVVVDAEGRPRPFAEVHPAKPFFDVVGDVQRLDPYTDARGVRVFARVQPGPCVVRASWAGHTGHGEVELVDEQRSTLRIVVP